MEYVAEVKPQATIGPVIAPGVKGLELNVIDLFTLVPHVLCAFTDNTPEVNEGAISTVMVFAPEIAAGIVTTPDKPPYVTPAGNVQI
jgi:hypothetical protein